MKLAARHERCSGCRVCQLVCAMHNFLENNPGKSRLKISGEFPVPGRYHVAVCDQCGACAAVCPTGAIVEDDGIAQVVEKDCIGCLACVEACPSGVMMVHPSREAPFKCNNCGKCIELCPREALYDEEKA
ncbi:MAG: 4Fe-4S dicluster domain-containing protein [Bacillota bacterium]